MKPIIVLALVCVAAAGCGRPVARLDKLSRVEAAVLTDASSLGRGASAMAGGSLQISDPDRLAALDTFLTSCQSKWKKIDGRPRPTRFQLQLIAGGAPLYTLWLEPGYMAMASGKKLQEARLSNADTAELMACLGLPPDYMLPPGSTVYGTSPQGVPYNPAVQQAMPAATSTPSQAGLTGSARL